MRDMDKWVSDLQKSKQTGDKKQVESALSDIIRKATAGSLNKAQEEETK